MIKHYNIPIFIPHEGCKNECIFCSQRIITGQRDTVTDADIKKAIEVHAGYLTDKKNADIEIAFFGGSFTGIGREKMISFLDIASGYIGYKNIRGIRISTRPDYIDEETLGILNRYGVKSVELGIQSMDDDVLAASKRGHKASHTVEAAKLIKSYGFGFTGQMMIGLPESTIEKEIGTAESMVSLGIDSARIYPALVFRGTLLDEYFKSGRYVPLTLEEAVVRAKLLKKLFYKNDITVIRMGLCSSDNLGDISMYTGPYHPAFGELVESAIWYDVLSGELQDKIGAKKLYVHARKSDISKITGNKKNNINKLKKEFQIQNIKLIQDEKYYIEVEF